VKIPQRTLLFILFTGCLLLLVAAPIRSLIAFVIDFGNIEASQIAAVPFITAGLIYLNRKKIFESVHYSALAGSVVLALGFGLGIAARRMEARLELADRLALWTSALVVMWLGGFLFFYGGTAFRKAMFPLLFLLLAIPIPSVILNPLITFLQYRSADAAYGLVSISGTPVYREGLVFVLPDLTIQVAPECSGIRSGISLVITALVAGYVLLQSRWKRVALLVIAAPVAIFKNGLRIATLTLLAVHMDHRILTSELHREGGIPFFFLSLVLLSPVLTMLVKSERR
jgi:exosortase